MWLDCAISEDASGACPCVLVAAKLQMDLVPSDNARVDTTCQDDASTLLALCCTTVSYSPSLVSISAHSGTFTEGSDRSFKSSSCFSIQVLTKLFNNGKIGFFFVLFQEDYQALYDWTPSLLSESLGGLIKTAAS